MALRRRRQTKVRPIHQNKLIKKNKKKISKNNLTFKLNNRKRSIYKKKYNFQQNKKIRKSIISIDKRTDRKDQRRFMWLRNKLRKVNK